MKIAVVTSLAAKRYVKVNAGHVYAAMVQELGGRKRGFLTGLWAGAVVIH